MTSTRGTDRNPLSSLRKNLVAAVASRREVTSSLIQAAKARARDYRGKTKMITIIYLTAAKLQLLTLTNPAPAYMFSR